jgi:uncharacterized protein (TIGR03118 family)
VSDLPGVAQVQDPNLVNPWGISENAGSPFWIADNNAGVSTLYSVPGANNTPVSVNGLVVSIPTPGDPTGASGAPTGTVFNPDLARVGFPNSNGTTSDPATSVNPPEAGGGFPVSDGTRSAPAIVLFATEDGTIVGWNPAINPPGSDPTRAGTFGIIAVDNSGNNFTNPDPNQQTGAVYTGLTIATSSTPIFADDPASTAVLYAANFRSGQVEVYDSAFRQVTPPPGAFSDPNLPGGYAPFNVQVFGNQVYVTYARQNAARHDPVGGFGHGFIDVYNLDGTPGLDGGRVRLISRDPLDSPWGLAIAPPSFGSLAGDLLVGNFGSGFIDAVNPTTGEFLGTLQDPDGEPIQIDGLWALTVGNGTAGGDGNTLYFTAGLAGKTHGLLGSLTPVALGSPEGAAEAQAVTAALDVFQLNLATVQQDLSTGVTSAQLQQDVNNLQTSFVDLVRAEIRATSDTVADGQPVKSEVRDGGFALLSALQHKGGPAPLGEIPLGLT